MKNPNDKLYVVTCIFNPESYKSRYNLYNNFANYISNFSNAELWTVELTFEGQDFVVTQSDCPQHIQLKTNEILWYKENLLNMGISKLPEDAKYIAWIDADIEFENQEWVDDTITALNQYDFVQMFERANDLGPDGEIIASENSFINRWVNRTYTEKRRGRSGLAWAATKEALNKVDMLIDWGIVGSADWFMAFALTNQSQENNLHTKSGGHSTESLQKWSDKCALHIKENVGYVKGVINHFWHGKKSNRGYNWRWKILSDNEFNPINDLDYHPNGLIRLKTNKPKLLEDIKYYFRSREEDDIEK
jgi:hypothetical protein